MEPMHRTRMLDFLSVSHKSHVLGVFVARQKLQFSLQTGGKFPDELVYMFTEKDETDSIPQNPQLVPGNESWSAENASKRRDVPER